MRTNIDQKNIKKLLAGFMILISLGLMAIRCFYGINFDDELAYISVVKRMTQGQWIILQDWNTPTLLSSWLTYQLLRFSGVFQLEACVVILRLIYIFFQCLVAGTLFWWFRKRVWCPAAILVYLFATPYNIYTFSYNTLSIGFMILTCAYIATRDKWGKVQYLLCGILFSLCVLGNPFAVLLFVIYFLCTITMIIKKSKKIPLLTLEGFLFTSLGAFCVMTLFIVSMLTHGSIKEYMENAVLLLNDAEHTASTNLISQVFMALYQIVRVYWRISIPMIVLTGITLFWRSSRDYGKYLMMIAIAVTAYGIIRFSFIYGSVYPNLMLVSLNFIGIEAYLLTREKNKVLFYGWFIVGLLYSICIFVGTNTGILSGSAAFVVPSVACVLLLLDFAKEHGINDSVSAVNQRLIYGLVILELACIFWLHITYVWADGQLKELTYQVERGPCKYLYTSEESFAKYEGMLNLVEEANLSTQDNTLFMPMQPLYYLAAEGSYATPYTKRFQVNFLEVQKYFTQNPEELPSVVIASKECEEEEKAEIQKVLEWFKQQGYREDIGMQEAVILKGDVK